MSFLVSTNIMSAPYASYRETARFPAFKLNHPQPNAEQDKSFPICLKSDDGSKSFTQYNHLKLHIVFRWFAYSCFVERANFYVHHIHHESLNLKKNNTISATFIILCLGPHKFNFNCISLKLCKKLL